MPKDAVRNLVLGSEEVLNEIFVMENVSVREEGRSRAT